MPLSFDTPPGGCLHIAGRTRVLGLARWAQFNQCEGKRFHLSLFVEPRRLCDALVLEHLPAPVSACQVETYRCRQIASWEIYQSGPSGKLRRNHSAICSGRPVIR